SAAPEARNFASGVSANDSTAGARQLRDPAGVRRACGRGCGPGQTPVRRGTPGAPSEAAGASAASRLRKAGAASLMGLRPGRGHLARPVPGDRVPPGRPIDEGGDVRAPALARLRRYQVWVAGSTLPTVSLPSPSQSPTTGTHPAPP